MSVIRCYSCERFIDTDFDVEHESECNEPQEINNIEPTSEVEFTEVF